MADGSLQKELDALRSDIASVQADIGRITETIKKTTGESIQDTGESIRRRFEELQRRIQGQASQALGAARTRGRRSVEGVEHQIEERPFVSMLIAFGVGLLISYLLGRR